MTSRINHSCAPNAFWHVDFTVINSTCLVTGKFLLTWALLNAVRNLLPHLLSLRLYLCITLLLPQTEFWLAVRHVLNKFLLGCYRYSKFWWCYRFVDCFPHIQAVFFFNIMLRYFTTSSPRSKHSTLEFQFLNIKHEPGELKTVQSSSLQKFTFFKGKALERFSACESSFGVGSPKMSGH